MPKRVRYWRATVLEPQPRDADAEIDEVRWLRRKAATALLSYADDRDLVDVALAAARHHRHDRAAARARR